MIVRALEEALSSVRKVTSEGWKSIRLLFNTTIWGVLFGSPQSLLNNHGHPHSCSNELTVKIAGLTER